MKFTRVHAILTGLALALVSGVIAQTGTGVQGPGVQGSGGSPPAGSNFSTQYRDGDVLGGAGPGAEDLPLVSNGAASAPTFQILPVSGGGSGQAALANDSVFMGNGTAAASVVTFPDCTDVGGNHLNFEQSSDTFTCGTSGGGGVTQTADTFVASWNGFTTAVTNTWSYVVTGEMVVLMPQALATGTSNSTSFTLSAGALPAAIRPLRTVTDINISSTDNGAASGVGCVAFLADGSVVLSRTISGGACQASDWTASGTKAAFNGYQKAFTYPLN